MSGHLCLKWNNHSSAFLKSVNTIQVKEKYCDATIACQGKYFPVHRIVLSTCSEYFDEMFDRIQCQHPYIVFKDIEPGEMELLLNYMYQGEVNVVQEKLPMLIKAAEALKIKGLAVPDDLPTSKDSSSGKRKSSSDNTHVKRRGEDSKRRKGDSFDLNEQNLGSATLSDDTENISSLQSVSEPRLIKEEPLDTSEYGDGPLPFPSKSQPTNEDENFISFPLSENPDSYVKQESAEDKYDNQSSSWADFGSGIALDNLPPPEVGGQDNMHQLARMNWVSTTEKPPCIMPNQSTTSYSSGSSNQGDIYNTADMSSTSSDRLYACKFCNHRSHDPSSLKIHVKFKHSRERPYSCSFCSYRFVLKHDLQRHIRTHTGIKPHKCTKCSKSFIRLDKLRNHMRLCRY